VAQTCAVHLVSSSTLYILQFVYASLAVRELLANRLQTDCQTSASMRERYSVVSCEELNHSLCGAIDVINSRVSIFFSVPTATCGHFCMKMGELLKQSSKTVCGRCFSS
jgi:hypothetical protein